MDSKRITIRSAGECEMDVRPLLRNMLQDQIEHNYADFGSVYCKYRRSVVAWIMEICDYFRLHPTTVHASIAYLDRIQPNDRFSRSEWQMLAISCILIAAKYNETEENVPSRILLEEITEQRISNKVILSFEIWILMKMSWKLNAFTPMAFLSNYMSYGVSFHTDRCAKMPQLDIRLNHMNARLVALANAVALEESLKPFKASDIAATLLSFVREELRIVPHWRKELTELTRTEIYSPVVSKIARLVSLIVAVPESDSVPETVEPSSPTTSAAIAAAAAASSTSASRSTTTESAASVCDLRSPDGKENSKGISHTSPNTVTAYFLEEEEAL